MTYYEYMNIPFEELFHTVFTDSGKVKACGCDACRALIDRINIMHVSAFGTSYPGSLGNAERGLLVLPDAFTVAKKLMGE